MTEVFYSYYQAQSTDDPKGLGACIALEVLSPGPRPLSSSPPTLRVARILGSDEESWFELHGRGREENGVIVGDLSPNLWDGIGTGPERGQSFFLFVSVPGQKGAFHSGSRCADGDLRFDRLAFSDASEEVTLTRSFASRPARALTTLFRLIPP